MILKLIVRRIPNLEQSGSLRKRDKHIYELVTAETLRSETNDETIFTFNSIQREILKFRLRDPAEALN